MEMTEKPLTEKESLALIQRMITGARSKFANDSFFYLLWGWLVLVAALGHYVLLQLGQPWAEAVWFLMPLGGIITAVYSRRQSKQLLVRTHLDRVMGYLWGALVFSFVLTLVFMGRLGQGTYPVILMLYGIGLFVSGGTIRFRPLIVGGIICWAVAVVAFFLPFEQQLLCLAFAVLAGYIIPGYMLKARGADEAV